MSTIFFILMPFFFLSLFLKVTVPSIGPNRCCGSLGCGQEGVVRGGWHWQVIILDNLWFFAIMGEMGFGVLCCLRIFLGVIVVLFSNLDFEFWVLVGLIVNILNNVCQ